METRLHPDIEEKIGQLVLVTRTLTVPHLLQLRRMTIVDPETQKWATLDQLDKIFTVLLQYAIARLKGQVCEPDDLLPAEGTPEELDFERNLLVSLLPPPPPPPEPEDADSANADDEAKAGNEGDATTAVVLMSDDDPIPDQGDFATVFDGTILWSIRQALKIFRVTEASPHNTVALTFLFAPSFADTLERVLRHYVLPVVRNTKKIKELSKCHRWENEGSSHYLMTQMQMSGGNNHVMSHWDARWNAFSEEGQGTKLRSKTVEGLPWDMFQDDAKAHHYIAPTESDIPLLQNLLRFNYEDLQQGWDALKHAHNQEFFPPSRGEKARDGTFRDTVLSSIEEQNFRGGDLLTIKAFFELQRCDRALLRSIVQSLGRTKGERRRHAPILYDFFESISGSLGG